MRLFLCIRCGKGKEHELYVCCWSWSFKSNSSWMWFWILAWIFIHLMIQSDLPGFSSIGLPRFSASLGFSGDSGLFGHRTKCWCRGTVVVPTSLRLADTVRKERFAVSCWPFVKVFTTQVVHHMHSYAISVLFAAFHKLPKSSGPFRISGILRFLQPFFCSWVLGLQVPIVVPSRYHGWMHRCQKNSTEISRGKKGDAVVDFFPVGYVKNLSSCIQGVVILMERECEFQPLQLRRHLYV